MPEFQSSPSRRQRTDDDDRGSVISGSIQNEKTDRDIKRQIQLEKKRERSRASRARQTDEQRQIRLEKDSEQHELIRMMETDEQSRIRLDRQKKLSKTNRLKKKIQRQSNENINTDRNNVGPRSSVDLHWPEPIAQELKQTCLQQFLAQMSMSELAEVTCAVCNSRTPTKDIKTMSILQIPNSHLLKLSDELKDLVKRSAENTNIPSNHHTGTTENTESNTCSFTISKFTQSIFV